MRFASSGLPVARAAGILHVRATSSICSERKRTGGSKQSCKSRAANSNIRLERVRSCNNAICILNRLVQSDTHTHDICRLTWRDFISTRSANAINLGKSVAACVCGPSTTRPKRRRRQNKQKGQITIRELYKFAKIRYKQTFIFYACLRVEIKRCGCKSRRKILPSLTLHFRRVRVTVETGGGNVANQQSSIKIGSAFSVLPSSYLFIADFSELNKTNCYAAKFNRNEQPEAGSVKDSSRRWDRDPARRTINAREKIGWCT
jgi:hypothetical protein